MNDTAEKARPRRRGWVAAVVAVVVVLLLIVAVAVADLVMRGVIERRIADEITAALPPAVDAEPTVTLHGGSALLQLASGRLDRVDIAAPDATVDGIPVAVRVRAHGLPTGGGPVDRIGGTLTLAASDAATLATIPGATGELSFGEGTVAYDGALQLFGFPIGYRVTVRPEAAGDTILLRPESAEISAAGGQLDADALLESLTGGEPIAVCVAQYLPEGVEVTSLEVDPEEVVVRLEAADLALTEEALSVTGSC